MEQQKDEANHRTTLEDGIEELLQFLDPNLDSGQIEAAAPLMAERTRRSLTDQPFNETEELEFKSRLRQIFRPEKT